MLLTFNATQKKSDNDENHKDDDDDETNNSQDHENSNGSTKSNEVSVEERLKALIDTNKLACLLCKRQFDSIDILNKHTVKSDLHKVCYTVFSILEEVCTHK